MASGLSRPESPRAYVFISHLHEDKVAAEALATRLQKLSHRIDAHVAGNPKFDGPRFGEDINQELRRALRDASLVLLLFTSKDRDWTYPVWECSTAQRDETVPTRVVTLRLGTDSPPKILKDALWVDVSQQGQVESFVIQLCTDLGFIPSLPDALVPRPRTDPYFKEQARLLFEELQPYIVESRSAPRWSGFTATIDAATTMRLRGMDSPPTGAALGDLLANAKISEPFDEALRHFGFVDLQPEMTVATLRKRWEERRGPNRIKNKPWSEVIGDEFWRIVTSREPEPTSDPFLSIRRGQALWLYPIVYRFRHHGARYEFDILLVQTPPPEGAHEVELLPAGGAMS